MPPKKQVRKRKSPFHFSESQKAEIWRLFNLPDNLNRKRDIRAFAKTIGKTPASLKAKYAKLVAENYQSTNGNLKEIRVKYSLMSIDLDTKEIVFKLI